MRTGRGGVTSRLRFATLGLPGGRWKEATMRLSGRDGVATVLVRVAVLLHVMWLAAVEVFGMSSARVVRRGGTRADEGNFLAVVSLAKRPTPLSPCERSRPDGLESAALIGVEMYQPSPDWRAETEPFTRREVEVIEMIATGLRTREVAAILCIAPDTVSTHIENAMHKCKARSRAGLVGYHLTRGGVRGPSAVSN